MNADFDSETLGKLKSLIKEHNPLEIPDAIPTYMELCRYPGTRLEEIWSRLFAFFFNPNKPHGFGTMFLDSLNELLEKNGKSKISAEQNFEIETEHKTGSGKKIDLLIVSDKNIICIENKIWAPANNDFEEYKKEVDKIKYDLGVRDESCFLILLCPRKHYIKLLGWTKICYEDFIEVVKNKKASNFPNKDANYLFVLNDWIETMEHEIMEPDCLKIYKEFFDEYSEQLRKLNDFRKEYEKECRHKARELCQVCNYDDNNQILKKIRMWACGGTEYIHITSNCYIDSVLWRETSKELQIRIVNRNEKDLNRLKNVKSDLFFSESKNRYTIVKRKKIDEDRITDAEFVVTELQKIFQQG